MPTRQERQGGAQPTRGARINGDDEAKSISERDAAARRSPGTTQTVRATATRPASSVAPSVRERSRTKTQTCDRPRDRCCHVHRRDARRARRVRPPVDVRRGSSPLPPASDATSMSLCSSSPRMSARASKPPSAGPPPRAAQAERTHNNQSEAGRAISSALSRTKRGLPATRQLASGLSRQGQPLANAPRTGMMGE